MANVFDGLTKTMLYSAKTTDYIGDTRYAVDPDMPPEVPYKYVKVVAGSKLFKGSMITTGIPEEMNQSEKDIVDAAELSAAKTERITYLNNRGDAYLDERYPYGIDDQFVSLYIQASRDRPNLAEYIRPFIEWKEKISDNVESKKEDVENATSVSEVQEVSLDESTLTSQDPGITMQEALEVVDPKDLTSFLNANAVVEDPPTGVQGAFWLMQILMNRRELYNDADNPLYIGSGFTAILGNYGSIHLCQDRILNLENIHDKLGWHEHEVLKSLYQRPKDLLVYYGYPSSFNYGVNSWNNEKVAQDMSKYSLIVLADTVENPSHPDYANTEIIIPRIKDLNPRTMIFGYIPTTDSLVNFETKVDQWDTLGVHGIFMDESGYDYGTPSTNGRDAFNEKLDYVHGRSNANLCFVNSWNTKHVLGTENDPIYPNSTWNPSLSESKLGKNDWILLESFPVNTTSYSASDGYESKTDWLYRGEVATSLRSEYGVNFACLGIINNGNGSGQNLFNFQFISSVMFALDAVGTSDEYYGASSATVTYWARPDVSKMGQIYCLYPSVCVDALDADVYHRYVDFGRFMVDFSSGEQTSSVTKT